jgi:hypothetical protein
MYQTHPKLLLNEVGETPPIASIVRINVWRFLLQSEWQSNKESEFNI